MLRGEADGSRSSMHLRVALAQIDPTVGDLSGNTEMIRSYLEKADKIGSDIVAFPELAVTGYPPLDLLPPRETRSRSRQGGVIVEDFVRLNKDCVLQLAQYVRDMIAIIGFVDYDDRGIFNAAAVINRGRVISIIRKTLLPTYDVFDEARYFIPAQENKPVVVRVRGGEVSVGVAICEDIWDEELGYEIGVADQLGKLGAQVMLSINASPFRAGIRQGRLRIVRSKVSALRIPIFYVNMAGGQDELVFDGSSFGVDRNNRLIAVGESFQEDFLFADVNIPNGDGIGQEKTLPAYSREEELFDALVLGVRDYFRKTGFRRALIGLSGGIDSSLVAAIAVTALGRQNVIGVSMPSHYSSEHSKRDAREVAANLGFEFLNIPINTIFQSYLQQLSEFFKGSTEGVAEENIQARIRGNILMAFANKFGGMVLATGNKTELALGYSTLYGDMSGGLEVIGDVSKTEVYALARYYNQMMGGAIIPENCFQKVPSAELRAGQYDPFDYNVVSPLVEEIVENRLSKAELIQKGFPMEIVDDVIRRLRNAEYKRRQAPPTIKITAKAFGLGWKMPIVNKFSG